MFPGDDFIAKIHAVIVPAPVGLTTDFPVEKQPDLTARLWHPARVNVLGEPSVAWEPLTPRGVAAFARASFGRLWLVQTLFAAAATVAVLWVLVHGICPVVSTAIDALPATGEIRNGRLDWHGDSPRLLAENRILAFSVDLNHTGKLRSPADFQFELGQNSLFLHSLAGTAEWPWPPGLVLPAGQQQARSAWGAWVPDLLAVTAAATFFGLLATWTVLATVYAVPVWIIGFFGNRNLGLGASWRLAGAALMPGAALMAGALVFYELGGLDLMQLALAFGLHLVAGWIYLFVSPLFLDRATPEGKKNPFNAGRQK